MESIKGNTELEKELNKLRLENASLKEEVKLLEKEVFQRKMIMAEKHQQLSDSINYALRIQQAILPPDYLVQKYLPDSFIFYRPKDVVSGDFYFVDSNNDKVVFSAVDCTGHGVPGALMSVIGFNYLDQAVREKGMTNPGDILHFLDAGVNDTLRQTLNESGVRDSMDLALCSIDFKTNILEFSGSNNPVYIISNGHKKREVSFVNGTQEINYEETEDSLLTEIRADKWPIGVNEDGIADIFTNHTVKLQKGDMVYIFSDGYADQFGGDRGKKFKYNQFKKLLLSIHNLDLIEQERAVINAFDEWKGQHWQIDDVLIMGLKITS